VPGKAGGRGAAPATRTADGRVSGMGGLVPPPADRSRHERVLLALVIGHPRLLDDVGDRLGETAFADSALDNLRRGILKHHVTRPDLDGEALRAYLRSDGFSQALESLLDANDCTIARPDALHDAKLLWEHVFSLYQRSELRAEAGQAADMLARDMSDANWARQAAVVTSHLRSSDIDGGE
jgi:DNA primase